MTGSRAAGCGSCSWRGDPLAAALVPDGDLVALEPGSTVPVGLCPSCNAFAYLTPARGDCNCLESKHFIRLGDKPRNGDAMTTMTCNRCDHAYEADLVRHLEEGGPPECSRCGLALPEPEPEWLLANGYNVTDEDL